MPRGGARPGAGRPRKAVKFQRPINVAEKKIADKLPHLVDKMLELADGVTVQETDKDGEERVYTRPPDRHAAEYLLNRIMGKPTERHEMEADVAVTGGLPADDRLTPEQRAAVRSALTGRPLPGGPAAEPEPGAEPAA